MQIKAIYDKNLVSDFYQVETDLDSDVGYYQLKEDLLNNLLDVSENIYYIENRNTRSFSSIFDTFGSDVFSTENDFEVVLNNGEIDLEENEETLNFVKDMKISKFEARGYGQSDWDTYYIYFDSSKISEKEIENLFGNLRYMFTVSNLNIFDIQKYDITITNQETGEVIEERTEVEKEYIDNYIIYGDEKSNEVEEKIKEIYSKKAIVFNI